MTRLVVIKNDDPRETAVIGVDVMNTMPFPGVTFDPAKHTYTHTLKGGESVEQYVLDHQYLIVQEVAQ